MNTYTVKSGELDIFVNEYIPAKVDNPTDVFETIIFLHYSGGNIKMWDQVIPHFQSSYRLVLIDLRGHGKSSKPKLGYHIDDMAKDVMQVLKALQIRQAHIVGSSMGAEVGLALTRFMNDRVQSLTCEGALYSEFGPFGIFNGPKQAFDNMVKTSINTYKNRKEACAPSLDALIDQTKAQFIESGIWNDQFESIIRYGAYPLPNGQFVTGMSRDILVEYMKHYYTYKFEDYYKELSCPVLMLPHADPETKKEIDIMNALMTLTNDCHIHQIEKWQHAYGWILNPSEASQTVLDFIGGK